MIQPQRDDNDHAQSNSLLLGEAPSIVQPKAEMILGQNEARFIQQIYYWLTHPHYDVKLKLGTELRKYRGRWYVKVPPPLLLNRWRGRMRYMSEPTLKRTIASLKTQAVLLTETFGGTTNYYAIYHEILNEYDEIYTRFFEQVDDERERARFDEDAVLQDISSEREEELYQIFRRELEEAKKRFAPVKEGAELTGSDANLDPYQNDTHTVSVPDAPEKKAKKTRANSVNLTPYPTHNDSDIVSKRDSSSVKLTPRSSNRNKLEKQQQEISSAPTFEEAVNSEVVVVSSEDFSSNSPDLEPAKLREEMRAFGVSYADCKEFLDNRAKNSLFYPQHIREQLTYIPWRGANDLGLWLTRSIREGWAPPKAWVAEQERLERAKSVQAKQVAAAPQKAAEEATTARVLANLAADDARIEAILANHTPEQRLTFDETVKELLHADPGAEFMLVRWEHDRESADSVFALQCRVNAQRALEAADPEMLAIWAQMDEPGQMFILGAVEARFGTRKDNELLSARHVIMREMLADQTLHTSGRLDERAAKTG